MLNSKASIALVALLAAALSTPVVARNGGGQSGGRSGGHGARGSSGGHSHSRAGGFAPHRYFAGRPRIGLFLGAPVFAAPYYYFAPLAPMPPIEYIEKPPDGVLYFCPETNGYYPAIQQCPGGWEMVPPSAMQQPSDPALAPSAGAWPPLPSYY